MNKIIVDRKMLIEALQKIIGPTTGKISFPVFSSVLIEQTNKGLKFITTDLELTMTAQIDVDAPLEKRESFCVSLPKLLSILKEFSEEKIEMKPQKNFLWINCGKCELKLHVMESKEFPKIPTLKNREAIRLSAADLKEMIRLSSFAVFVGEGNYVLNGILCSVEKNKIKFAATDGKRLAVIEKRLPADQPEINTKRIVIIPQKSIIELNKLLPETDEDIFFIIGKNKVSLEFGKTQMITQLIEGEFPEYEKYIPAKAENRLKIDRQKFLAALRRANILSAPEYQGVKIDLSANKAGISKSTPQLGEYREEIGAEYKGKNVSFGFNPAYLIDVLKVTEADEVCFDIYDSEKPVVLRNNGYTYLALPMRLN